MTARVFLVPSTNPFQLWGSRNRRFCTQKHVAPRGCRKERALALQGRSWKRNCEANAVLRKALFVRDGSC